MVNAASPLRKSGQPRTNPGKVSAQNKRKGIAVAQIPQCQPQIKPKKEASK